VVFPYSKFKRVGRVVIDMGSLTRGRAENRFTTAFQQRLEAAETAEERENAYKEAIDELVAVAMDEEELHRIAVYLAEDPEEIEWPDGFDPDEYR
jgi:hypothetical protein